IATLSTPSSISATRSVRYIWTTTTASSSVLQQRDCHTAGRALGPAGHHPRPPGDSRAQRCPSERGWMAVRVPDRQEITSRPLTVSLPLVATAADRVVDTYRFLAWRGRAQ